MKLPRVSINYRVLIPLVVLFLVLTLIFPRTAKFSYDYRKGSPWSHETLLAQFDFPILKTDEQIREEKSRSKSVVIPYYRYRQDIVDNCRKAAEGIDMGRYSYLRPLIVASMDGIYSNGVVPDEGVKLDGHSDPSGAVLYIQKDKRAGKKPVSEVFKESEAKNRLLSDIAAKYPRINADSVLRSAGIYDFIVPNLEYDPKTTELVRSESSNQVSTTQGFVSAGQLIVSEGEIVTAEIAQMLDSYKVEYENSMGYGGPRILFWLGNAFIAFALVLLFFLMIYFLNRRLFMDHRKFWYLIFIFIIASVLALIINKFAPRCLYMVPFTLTALYLEAFFKNKVIFPICCVSFLPLLVFAENGVVLFVMFLLASIVAVFTFRFFNQGWQQFIMSGIVFVSILVTYFGFRMIDMVNDDPYMAVLYMFIGSMLIVAGYPLIYLFERMFNLVSSSRLRELCDTNNKLLRELEHKAPGTFQHSLQVMNMCDAAARAIDANVLLVRAGALYHDIGKMKNPLCFIENESMSPKGVHYHEHLSPKESARAIIKHVSDGLELAAENRLPDVIQDFILTHHGTSNTSYFYNKYLNEGGDPNDVSDFFYKGRKPQTKEQIILMICDTLEAASRTLKDNSAATFSVFVENIVASKMKIGQFDQADISIKDLNTVKETLKAYLSQIYHERVVYPQRKNN
ncbi:MAG: HDIG domain-containing protein [Alistipes sp.]|mgnify:FL=1|jgi:putative nucleotidyltransferase with HDIG domain|nr:HDIG domain-containing protein [Alistipes sp.]MCI6438974.1 HDIG domain-containing protein [Alistipes sp.]MDD7711892.1 HDIG domain-containing protein [Alistipes sp.]MDY3834985.1 HDIG domain-containing protein [Candidatus Cryptobacteroides sp.]CDD17700.1 transmembrane HD family protein [Alistipes sp. CAG:435]